MKFTWLNLQSTQPYQLIIKDFKAASILLQKHTSASDKGRATKGAALGLLSKVYLTQQDWENAYLTAGDVIEAGTYSLHADFATNWKEAGKNGKESVFEFYKNATAENSQMVISGLPSLPGVFSAGVETSPAHNRSAGKFRRGRLQVHSNIL